jgi:hypothetical protein
MQQSNRHKLSILLFIYKYLVSAKNKEKYVYEALLAFMNFLSNAEQKAHYPKNFAQYYSSINVS